ncbi:hypothetical protein I7I50_11640 [Histoplasma capsulatum G186AR]|uniref:Uncharacterized protein n=1 Tax=Ajellomyces capsulatus TaxID=5037 RepID=A0A8H8D8C2_AJECA|nr:hypothetical protein I7I52_02877 [Histoplasma capsulatum]QSS70115.1 hypothetical protein I7I50_11640 [Histoplasma capsulatum G186AR]
MQAPPCQCSDSITPIQEKSPRQHHSKLGGCCVSWCPRFQSDKPSCGMMVCMYPIIFVAVQSNYQIEDAYDYSNLGNTGSGGNQKENERKK